MRFLLKSVSAEPLVPGKFQETAGESEVSGVTETDVFAVLTRLTRVATTVQVGEILISASLRRFKTSSI